MKNKSKTKLSQNPFIFIFYFLKPYSYYILGILFITIIWAANRTIEPYIVKLMLDTLEQTSSAQTNLFSKLQYPLFFFIFLKILMNFVNRLHDYFYLKTMPSFEKNIVIRLTKYLQKHSQSYFQHHFGGSLVSNISTLAESSRSILDEVFYNFIFPLLTLIIITLTIASVNYTLGIMVLIWTFIFIGVSYYLSRQIHEISEELTEKSTTLVGKLLDSITNILAVRLFGHRKYEIAFLDTSAREKVEKEKELGWSNIKLNFVMDIMANILIIYLISFLIFERQKGRVSIGDFTLVFTLALSVIDIVWDVSRHYMRFVEEMGKSTHALKTLLIPHAIKDAENARPLIVRHGKIEFKNIYLTLDKNRTLFNNFSLTINAGEKVGIVGSSGSGKTTLLNLIVRLMDVEDGEILIDGQNIKDVTQDSLHQSISFIPQEPMLFHRTISENILYGRLNASKKDIKQVATKAFADEFIQNFPHGYNTLVGERGTTLSGGQRQRLAIARAFLKNSQILILDEATSALDSETEYYIQQSLESLMEHKTVLIVAHRLSTLMKMDRIIVLDKGIIVEEGRHKSLLRNKGQYYKYWTMQTHKSVI